MKSRIDYPKTNPEALRALLGLEKYLAGCGLEKPLLELIRLRVSQVNGCAFCIDMHWKDARAAGESQQRLYGLSAWQESLYYTDRERAALAWAESVTRLSERNVPDDVYDQVRDQFEESEIVDLTWAVASINSWNRLNIALRTPAGEYQPPKALQEAHS